MKTSELTGAQLDWAVLTVENHEDAAWYLDNKGRLMEEHGEVSAAYCPSTLWNHGGPIIERREIALCVCGTRWEAARVIDIAGGDTDTIIEYGPTPLVAAMRCYVASKLGDEIDVPF